VGNREGDGRKARAQPHPVGRGRPQHSGQEGAEQTLSSQRHQGQTYSVVPRALTCQVVEADRMPAEKGPRSDSRGQLHLAAQMDGAGQDLAHQLQPSKRQ
jgi:hypothetical protein